MEAIKLIDRLAFNVIGALHKLFGFTYSENTEPFIYQVTLDTTVDFAVGDTLQGSLGISQEADFICTRINCSSRWLAATDTSAVGMHYMNEATGAPAAPAGEPLDCPFTVELVSGGNDRTLQNQAVDARAAFGMEGGLPGILSKPRLFKRNSNLRVTLNMIRLAAVANADSLRNRILFIGWKVYDAEALDLTARRA